MKNIILSAKFLRNFRTENIRDVHLIITMVIWKFNTDVKQKSLLTQE